MIVLNDDLMNDRHAQACPFADRFGCKVLKDSGLEGFWYTNAIIFDVDKRSTAVSPEVSCDTNFRTSIYLFNDAFLNGLFQGVNGIR